MEELLERWRSNHVYFVNFSNTKDTIREAFTARIGNVFTACRIIR